MKLENYYLMQAELDQNIIEKKGLDPKKPEFMRKRIIAFKQEFGELLQRLPEVFKDWSNKKNIIDDETLEEWVDGFHFLLSISNWKDWNLERLNNYCFSPNALEKVSVWIYESDFRNLETYRQTFSLYYTFIRSLGYTDEQIEASYAKKNAVNFQRQVDNY